MLELESNRQLGENWSYEGAPMNTELSGRLRTMLENHNRDVLVDVVVRALLGGFWTLATFGAIFAASWLLVNFTAAWAITAIYAAVASWTAWRQGDPWNLLAPISRVHSAMHDFENLLAAGTRTPRSRPRETALRAMVLVAGPDSLIRAWRSYKRVLPQDPQISEAAAEILAECPQMVAVDLDGRACLLLARLGLIAVEADEDGDLHMDLTTKGRRLCDGPQPEPVD